MARRYRRRRAYTPRRRRRSSRSRKKNLFFTKIPTTVGSARYQVKQLALPSKAALGLIVAGAVMGPRAIAQAQQIPVIGRYAAMFAAMGARLSKKV